MIGNKTLTLMLVLSLSLFCCGCQRSVDQIDQASPLDHRAGWVLHADDDAKTVLEKAAKAVGDEKAQAQWKCGSVKFRTSGEFVPGEPGKCLIEETFQYPSRFKREILMSKGGEDFSLKFVQNDGEVWMKKGRSPAELLETAFAERDEHQFAEFARVPHAELINPRFIEPRGRQIDGHPVMGVRVRRKDRVLVDCWFSMETGLMLEITKTIPGVNTDKLVLFETHLSHYRKIRDCVVPMRIKAVQDGKTILDVTIISLKFEQRIGESEFAKP